MKKKPFDLIGTLASIFFLCLLAYAGYLSYKSIDWTVLTRMESQKLVLPTPFIATPSAQVITSTPSAKPTK